MSFEKRKFVYFFKPDYQGKYQGKSVSVKLKDSLIDFKQKINGTRFLIMFTLKFTTVRFFNVSELRSRISSRTQIPTKKPRFLGRPFALLVLLVCVTSILVGKNSYGFPAKSTSWNFHKRNLLKIF